MPHIEQLSAHVADLIAAGEVVERPASVVKELVENAIDAGAHTVAVEIQNGGMSLIRVTDDGCGIAPDELATAFLRHATSKIRTEYDLEAIGTLGFRGEALAATAAVARVQVLTRRAEDTLGATLFIEGGEVLGQEEAGCPQGTTMLVRDLFYNTPARLKFMKKDAAEGAACFAAIQRQALAHPEVSFKFIRDGKQELLTPGDGQLRSAMYAVFGRDLALGFTPVEGSGDDMSVSGFASLPTCCRGNRGYQFFFVNGRYVKSAAMTAALEQAYANQKMVGKFPGCVLHLKVKLNAVDVNVHPTKQEVKFGQERAVFSAVYYAVLAALGGDKTRPQVTAEEKAPPRGELSAKRTEGGSVSSTPASAELPRQTSLPLHDFTNPHRAVSAPSVETKAPLWGELSAKRTEGGSVPAAPAPWTSVSTPLPTGPRPVTSPRGGGITEEKTPPPQPVPAEKPAPAESPASEPPALTETEETPWRIAGELFRTYIIVEQGDKALLIDKHAAHERMNFDRMRAVDYVPMSQQLLTPVVFTPAPEEGAVLLENLDALDRVGFQVEDFGGGALAVRSIPDYLDVGEVPVALGEIAGKLSLTGSTGERERQDEIYHTMACKAAIKGGWKTSPAELERVVKAVMAGEVKYCPHGRPVCIELTKTELEKQFKRRT